MIGVKIKRVENDITIFGNPKLDPGGKYHIKKFLKDHRVFMMSVTAALTLNGKFTINDKDSIKTSFPNFLKIFRNMGAKIN